MLRILAKIVGAVFLLCGTFFFWVATVDMTSNVRIAGPMNLWPPPLWIYLIADVLFALLAILGMKLMKLKRIHIGFLMSMVSVLVLFFVIENQLHAPPRDGFSNGNHIAADLECYVAAYVIAQLMLFTGLWLIIQHVWRRRQVRRMSRDQHVPT
ncbi:MAG TPA: hypothetical protein VJR02_13130 [Pyrinomonadaceae bacterium]|nr:hypothetical protein [Pyrinomonadaceae bacterium]